MISASRSIAAIVLAAGGSTRMEHAQQRQNKLLLPMGDRPVISHVLDAAFASQAQPIVVVLGYQAPQVQEIITHYTIDGPVILIENPDFYRGMSTSLRLGIQTVQTLDTHTPMIGGAIVLLGDQPFISATIIDRLLQAREQTQKRIIAPSYRGKRGNPVLFDASLFPELLTISGDEGGRSVIANHPLEIELVEVDETMVDHDVDTWDAYQQAVTTWQKRQESDEKI